MPHALTKHFCDMNADMRRVCLFVQIVSKISQNEMVVIASDMNGHVGRITQDMLVYQVWQKSNPLKLFAVFSATAWDFCEILHVSVTILYTVNTLCNV